MQLQQYEAINKTKGLLALTAAGLAADRLRANILVHIQLKVILKIPEPPLKVFCPSSPKQSALQAFNCTCCGFFCFSKTHKIIIAPSPSRYG